jgi:hypothetical protein
MFLGLGQYSEEDIKLAPSSADLWTGSTYDIGMTPAAWVVDINQQPGSMPSGGTLPVLQSIVSGAASVVSKFFDLQSAKAQAEAVKKVTGVVPVTTVTPQAAGFSLGGSWPILAIIGIGAFLVMRGKGGGKEAPKQRRRRRK